MVNVASSRGARARETSVLSSSSIASARGAREISVLSRSSNLNGIDIVSIQR